MPDIFGASGQFSIGALGQQNQDAFNNAYGPQGFGGQTADYSAAGAAYGRATGGFNPTAAQAQPSVFDTGTSGIKYLPGGGIDQNDPGNIAAYYRLMGGGPSTPMQSPDMQRMLGYNPNAPIQNGFGYPGAMPPSQMFNPRTYAPAADSNAFRAQYLPGGGLDQNDPGNIAAYYRLMGGGGGMAQPAAMTNNPYMGQGFQRPPIGPNVDPGGEARMGQENFGFTNDYNLRNPDLEPNTFFNINSDPGNRNAITNALLMQSAQQARS
jgi:hypothetical protein